MSRDLFEVMEKIKTEIDAPGRSELWIVFSNQDANSEGYFDPNKSNRYRGEIVKQTHIDFPVPRDVKTDHLRHIVARILQDGYEYEDILTRPVGR